MKIIRSEDRTFIPAAHDDPADPGVLKKVLIEAGTLHSGSIQMLNWAKLLPGKAFAAHSHRDLQEVFVMVEGNALATVAGKEFPVGPGDVVVVDWGEEHSFKNESSEPAFFVNFGIVPVDSQHTA